MRARRWENNSLRWCVLSLKTIIIAFDAKKARKGEKINHILSIFVRL